jgi:hypothetical protein
MSAGAPTRNDPSAALAAVHCIRLFVVAFTLYPVIQRTSLVVGTLMYLLFTALFGFVISTVLVSYSIPSIATTFVTAAAMFGIMSIIGFTTKVDLSKFGPVLFMGLRGRFHALTKIATQPEKDFGELVRQRRRKRGLPVAPAGRVLPFLPALPRKELGQVEAVDVAAEALLQDDLPNDEFHSARVGLAERQLHEALVALENATVRGASGRELAELEQTYAEQLAGYELLWSRVSTRRL